MEDSEIVLELVKSLSAYREDFISHAYSTMGFLLLILGWIVTSKEARLFISQNHLTAKAAILCLILNNIAYAVLSFVVLGRMRSIVQKLDSIGDYKVLYGHHEMSTWSIWTYIGMQTSVGLVIIFVLVSVIRKNQIDPPQSGENSPNIVG